MMQEIWDKIIASKDRGQTPGFLVQVGLPSHLDSAGYDGLPFDKILLIDADPKRKNDKAALLASSKEIDLIPAALVPGGTDEESEKPVSLTRIRPSRFSTVAGIDRLTDEFPNIQALENVSVPAKTLSTITDTLGFTDDAFNALTLDINGGEYNILASAPPHALAVFDVIAVAVQPAGLFGDSTNNEDLATLLCEHGYDAIGTQKQGLWTWCLFKQDKRGRLLASLRNVIADKDELIAGHLNHRQEADIKFEALSKEFQALTDQSASRETILQEKLADQDDQRQALENALKDNETTIREFSEKIARQDKELAALRGTQADLAALQDSFKLSETTVQDLTDTIAGQEKELAALRRAETDLRILQERFDEGLKPQIWESVIRLIGQVEGIMSHLEGSSEPAQTLEASAVSPNLRDLFYAGDWTGLVSKSEDNTLSPADQTLVGAACFYIGAFETSLSLFRSALNTGLEQTYIHKLLTSVLFETVADFAQRAGLPEAAVYASHRAMSMVLTDEGQTVAAVKARAISRSSRLDQVSNAAAEIKTWLESLATSKHATELQMRLLDIEMALVDRAARRAAGGSFASDVTDETYKRAGRKRAGYLSHTLPRGRYFALNDIDRQLEESLLEYDDGFFVELGANDGVDQSNSLYFELNRGWRGVLVEPVLHQALRCQAFRSPATQVFCNACVGFDYPDETVVLNYANLMTVSDRLSTDLEDVQGHLEKAKDYLPQYQDTLPFAAVARPLSDILGDANAPALMDLLSLDVEGAELAVLRGLDFSRHRFKVICLESRKIEPIKDLLSGVGYSLHKKISNHDYVFVNRAGG